MTDEIAIFSTMITPEQCRMARSLLNWTQQRLADAAEVGIVTVRQFEAGKTKPQRSIVAAIERAMESQGAEFTDDGGVRPRLAAAE